MQSGWQLGDGIELGGIEPWHAEDFLAVLDRCRDHLAANIPAAHRVFTIEEAREYLQGWADGHARDTRHLFGIWIDEKLAGCLQLFNFDTGHGTCEMGVWLAPEFEGRGIVTRSCRRVVDWAIRVRGMRRVQWTNSPTNVRSSAVARRLGMTREGLLRSAWRVGGVQQDSEVWSIVAEEWPTPVWPASA